MYSVAVGLIGIMLSVCGIILGIGYAIDDRRLKEFGKSEMYQAVINGVIVGSLITAFGAGGFFTIMLNGMVGNAGISAACEQSMSGNYAICFAYDYLAGLNPIVINNITYPTLIETSAGLLVPISVLYASLGLLSSMKLSIGIITIGFSSALTPVLTALNYVLEILTTAVISIEVQAVLLKFISFVAMPVLLPVGMVLRTLYVTRRLGGAIMAIAIGLFAVFPMSYVLNAAMASNYYSSISNGAITSFVNTEIGTSGGILSSAESVPSKPSNQSSFSIGYFTGAINGLVQGFQGFINQLLSIVALIIIEVFFLPIFSLVITAISIRELARILGSEISFGGMFHF